MLLNSPLARADGPHSVVSHPRITASFFSDIYLYIAFAAALLAVILAYQFRLPFSVAVGGANGQPVIDRPLLSHVNDPEVDKASGVRFRWTTGDTELILQDWGAGNPAQLRVQLTRWQPNDNIANLTLYVNGLEFARPTASGQGWQTYTLPITDSRFLASDNLSIKFVTDTFVPKQDIPGATDPRRLGIQISSIRLLPLRQVNGQWRAVNGLDWSPFKPPPLDLTLYFIGSALAIYAGLTLFKLPRRPALAGAVLFSLAAAVALVWVRPYVTLFAGTFFLVLLAALGAGLLARLVVPRFFAWGGIRPGEWELNFLALLFALGFAIKLDMLLYPQTISFDLLYHVHRVAFILDDKLFWSIPSGMNEFGGQPVPYLPSYYIFLAPLARLLSPELLVQLSGILLDNVTIFFVYYLVKKHFDDGRAGLFAAWIYLLVPLAFISLSWGIYANLYGQILTLVLIVALVEGLDHMTEPRVFVPIVLLFMLTLLSHTSVFASIVPMFAIWIALIFILGRMWRARSFWLLIGSIALASVVAFFSYYVEFVGLVMQGTSQIVSGTAEPSAAPIGDQGLSFWQLLQPARTQFIAVPLYVYVAMLLGFAWLLYLGWRSPARGRFLLLTMLASWFIAFALLMYLRWDMGFSSRYVNFAMPAIALCAGVTAAWIYARGLAGRAIALGAAVLLAAQGMYHWYILVMFQYH